MDEVLRYMRPLEYFYYKYFRFQERVGNGAIARSTAAQIIAGLLTLTLFDVSVVINFLIKLPNWFFSPKFGIVLLALLMIGSHAIFATQSRFTEIISRYKNESGKKRTRGTIYAILWPVLVLGGVFYLLGLMMLHKI